LFAAPVDELTPFALEDYKEALSLAHEDADRGVDFPTLMRRVQDTLDQGDLGRARATLMGIQGSGKVSAPETPGWDRMLRALEAEEARAIEGQDAAGRQRASHLAERYYESVELYHRGDLEGARRGFKEVLDSGLIPEEMQKSLEQSIRRIDEAFAPSQGQTPQGGR